MKLKPATAKGTYMQVDHHLDHARPGHQDRPDAVHRGWSGTA